MEHENVIPDGNEAKREKVRVLELDLIDDAPDHPFGIRDDEEMQSLTESIYHFGVISPILVRKKEDGRYEMIAGHRRKFACLKLGVKTVPAIVREMTREEAIIAMVDSNMQRENIHPSERAFAYKMKMEALQRQGKRTDLTSTPMAGKLETADMIGKEHGESGDQVRRYIRLTYLIPELLEAVDAGKLGFRTAVELSFLGFDEQKDVSYAMDDMEVVPSHAQSRRLKKLRQEQEADLTYEQIAELMSEEKPNQCEKVSFPVTRIAPYFKEGTSSKEMQDTIVKALELYFRLPHRDASPKKRTDREAR